MNEPKQNSRRFLAMLALVGALALIFTACSDPTGYEGQQDVGDSSPDTGDTSDVGDADDTGDSGDEQDTDPPDACGDDCEDLAIDGECGPRAQSYYLEHHQWPDDEEFCDEGSLVDGEPSFPSPGGSAQWSCQGIDGGQTAQCSASRSQDCSSDRQPPQGWSQHTSGCITGRNLGWHGDCTVWDGGIWSHPFWQVVGVTERLAVARNNSKHYLAIEIETFGMPTTKAGRINIYPDTSFDISPPTIVSISRCPGDFHEEPLMEETGCYARHASGFNANFHWGGVDSDRDCQLESDESYFLNIIPTNSELGTNPNELEPIPDCDENACGYVYDPQ